MNTSVLKMGVIFSVGGLVGCGSTNMTPTGAEQTPREENCEFRMLTTLPEGYAEIAAIDAKPGGYRNIASFKEEIRPYVCQAGGDAAIAYANGNGMYIKATVLKETRGATYGIDQAAPVDASPAEFIGPKPKSETARTAGNELPATDGKCHYDTQCKGDRICIKGECEFPPPASVPPQPSARP